ncbi:hypothetical protein D3C83_142340 [compost metagenome]
MISPRQMFLFEFICQCDNTLDKYRYARCIDTLVRGKKCLILDRQIVGAAFSGKNRPEPGRASRGT